MAENESSRVQLRASSPRKRLESVYPNPARDSAVAPKVLPHARVPELALATLRVMRKRAGEGGLSSRNELGSWRGPE